jgi:hypothetical protein
MTRTRHWHWALMAGVFLLATLLVPRNAAGWSPLLPM